MKSGWPGVSIRLTVTSSMAKAATAERMALEGEGIGLGSALVDATEAVDDACGEKYPFGEGCLTSVYMRQDAEVEGSHGASCLPSRFQ